MFDVTNFLMRWLFLCNLIRDCAEIQLLPHNPNTPVQPVDQTMSHPFSTEEEWREGCLRGILSYPPGSQRLLVIDSMRAELVRRLSDALTQADNTLQDFELTSQSKTHESTQVYDKTKEEIQMAKPDDPHLDADLEILEVFKEETFDAIESQGENNSAKENKDTPSVTQQENLRPTPTISEVDDAQRTIRTVRDYLPQLVSVVLKSPSAFENRLLNPIDKLRSLIIKRCIEDANWGVDMCWLLEAEVGRAWKKLFEHRQQTGRRLIVVLPAEKAAVLAKIGSEKREAFDLLQDAEQVTAYGYTTPIDEESLYYTNIPNSQEYSHVDGPDCDSVRLPSSLSLRRCSHFGDTMHFIDRLTKISNELRHIPTIHRHTYLHQSLREMNRRLRRRMVTRGDVSLDVEDNRGPDEWPLLSDMSTDLLRYSVHLPLDPKQNNKWPGGEEASDLTNSGVVRVLNIVVEDCKTLASRERCPFLIHLEVAETGLSGNDSRLYASGAPGLGATVEEALSMSAAAATTTTDSTTGRSNPNNEYTAYQIPSELLTEIPFQKDESSIEREDTEETDQSNQTVESVRGGSQPNETIYYPSHPDPDDYFTSNPYNEVRQNQYEQLHHQMYNEQRVMTNLHHNPQEGDTIVSTGETLLQKVFGQPWEAKCEEVRQASPYGKTEGWRLASFIMKAGEDIRREAFVMQLISKLHEWFQTDIPEASRPTLRPYTIMCVGGDAGLVECLNNAKSVDELKKNTDNFGTLRGYFERAYGPPSTYGYPGTTGARDRTLKSSLTFEEAQENFLRSLVGYSLVCYILQIKDRHNANILIDREGNVIHIDFGFVLGDTPKMAKVPLFSERAPFKLSAEFWDVLGGWNVNQGGLGVRFCNMFESAFACAASHSEEIVSLVESTMLTHTQSPRQARALANSVRSRLRMRGPPGSIAQKTFIMELVNAALTSWGTSTYDWLQKNMNGYQ